MIPSNRAALSRPLAWRTLPTTLAAALGLGLLGACTATVSTAPETYYAPPPPPPPQYVPPPQQPDYAPEPVVNSSPAPVVEITVESDFYQPLESYGTWVSIDGYGRCWQPRNVGGGWRPYTNGQWVSTDAGWCWQSSESFGWATYHYGRWNQDPQRGWYWVPQTQWAPAWVSWREGGGYAGWAPLPPPSRPGFEVSINIEPRNFVFVDEHHFSDPVRPSTVIINNTTIINKTVIINNSRVTNNITVNGGPKRADIEKATGHAIKPVAVAQIRSREDARSGLKTQVRPAGNSPTVNHSRPAAAPSQPAHTNTNSPNHDTNTAVAVHDPHQDDARNAAAEKANADKKASQAAATKAQATKQSNASAQQEDGSRGQVRRPVDPQANQEAAAKEASERQSEAETKAKAEAAKSAEAKREAPTRNPEAGEAHPASQQQAQHVNPDAKAQADAKAKADAQAKAKADAKKKADAQKAKEDEEKRAEDNKTQQ